MNYKTNISIIIARLFKTAFQYMWRNIGLSIASITVMTLSFFIIILCLILYYGSAKIIEYIDSKPPLIIYLKGNLTNAEGQKFLDKVKNSGLNVDVNLQDYEFSKRDFKEKIKDIEVDDSVLEGVLPRIAFIRGDSQETLRKLISYLENDEEFLSLVDKQNIDKFGWYNFDIRQADFIRSLNEFVQVAGVVATGLLSTVSMILIFITTKLSIGYHSKELEIMNLVGAQGWFIRTPFIINGTLYGLVSGIISVSMIWGSYYLITTYYPNSISQILGIIGSVPWPEINSYLILQFYLYVSLAGAILGSLSSFIAVIKYVSK